MPKDKSNSDKRFLAVDIGNSCVDAALFCGCGLPVESWEAEGYVEVPLSESGGLADVLSAQFSSVPDRAVVGSVAGDFSQTAAAEAVKSVFGIDPVVAGCGMETGLAIDYENPDSLGIDRLANAAGLFARTRGACIAVDFGTATTFDCVSSEGRYLGGAIAAGLESFRKGLMQKAPALPGVPLEFPPSVMGTNTEDCIKSGTMFGYAKMVDAMVRALSSEMTAGADSCPRVVATGGLAQVVSGGCETVSATDKLLTLKGLVIILIKNERLFSL